MTENAIVWSYANAWEPIARMQPHKPAVVQGERLLSWADFDAQADALAARLIEVGLRHNSKVGVYLHNCAEFLTTCYATFKAGLAVFNANYRYTADELLYLFDNADAEVVFRSVLGHFIEDALDHCRGEFFRPQAVAAADNPRCVRSPTVREGNLPLLTRGLLTFCEACV